jgi:hypothetical protein
MIFVHKLVLACLINSIKYIFCTRHISGLKIVSGNPLSRIQVSTTELYYITGGGAPISLQSSKCHKKHGGFRPLLTPE